MSTLIDMARLTVEEGGGIATFEAVEVHSAYVARYLKLNDRRAYGSGTGAAPASSGSPAWKAPTATLRSTSCAIGWPSG